MRGDRPVSVVRIGMGCVFTPHARGSTSPALFRHAVVAVYPACAGIDLLPRNRLRRLQSLPRMRGDRPLEKGE